jgi:hypothetical protein
MQTVAVVLAAVALGLPLLHPLLGLVTWPFALVAIWLGVRSARKGSRPGDLRTGTRPWMSLTMWAGIVALIVSLGMGGSTVPKLYQVVKLATVTTRVTPEELLAGYQAGRIHEGDWLAIDAQGGQAVQLPGKIHLTGFPRLDGRLELVCTGWFGFEARPAGPFALRARVSHRLQAEEPRSNWLILEPCVDETD